MSKIREKKGANAKAETVQHNAGERHRIKGGVYIHLHLSRSEGSLMPLSTWSVITPLRSSPCRAAEESQLAIGLFSTLHPVFLLPRYTSHP